MKNLTPARLIQMWFAAVALIVVACIAFGVAMTLGTVVMLVGLSLVPPAILLILWPGVQPPTVAEVLRGAERRPLE